MTFFEDHLRAIGCAIDRCLGGLGERLSGAGALGRGQRAYRRDRRLQDGAEWLERWLDERGVSAPVERLGRIGAGVVLALVIVALPVSTWRFARPTLVEASPRERDEMRAISGSILARRAQSLQPGSPIATMPVRPIGRR